MTDRDIWRQNEELQRTIKTAGPIVFIRFVSIQVVDNQMTTVHLYTKGNLNYNVNGTMIQQIENRNRVRSPYIYNIHTSSCLTADQLVQLNN